MRLDFHNDMRLMQTGPQGGASATMSVTQARQGKWQQYQNAWNLEKDPVKKNQILEESIRWARKTGLLQAGSDAANKLETVAGDLEASRAQQAAGMGAAAGNAQIQQEGGKVAGVIGLENTEASSIFQSKMQEPMMVRGFFGSIKMFEVGICAIYNLCTGEKVNTAPFDQYMQELKEKFVHDPSINTSGVEAVDTSISSTGAEASVNGATSRAQGNLRTVSPQAINDMYAAVDAQIGGNTGGAPPVTLGQTQNAAMTSVAKLVQEHTLTQAQGQEVMGKWMTAASLGGNKASVDAKPEAQAVENVIDKMIRDAATRGKVAQALKLDTAGVSAPAPSGP